MTHPVERSSLSPVLPKAELASPPAMATLGVAEAPTQLSSAASVSTSINGIFNASKRVVTAILSFFSRCFSVFLNPFRISSRGASAPSKAPVLTPEVKNVSATPPEPISPKGSPAPARPAPSAPGDARPLVPPPAQSAPGDSPAPASALRDLHDLGASPAEVRSMLAAGADVNAIQRGMTPLMRRVCLTCMPPSSKVGYDLTIERFEEIFRIFVEYGADLTIGVNGTTPLAFATRMIEVNSSKNIPKASATARRVVDLLTQAASVGSTVVSGLNRQLFDAVVDGNSNEAERLIRAGANVNAVDRGATPLIVLATTACLSEISHEKFQATLEVLMRNGAGSNGSDGNTAIELVRQMADSSEIQARSPRVAGRATRILTALLLLGSNPGSRSLLQK